MIDKSVFLADGSKVIGEIKINKNSSVWFNAVIRGDSNIIEIGENTNVQDNAVIHTSKEYGVVIKDNVSIGHGAIIHGCNIGNNVLIGMGAIILDNVNIGDNCIIGAGTLITQNKVIPEGSLVYGNPMKIVRNLTEEEKKSILENALEYVHKSKAYKNNK
ncbi:MAG: gamma carbonic anhydrase family protein [Bacilli bacterium]|nr:gamma carbonic anhydrase family protein [Bacilli bacterium]